MLKGRTTFPRYTVTCDVKYVLHYVKKCSISSETSLESTSNILATMKCLLRGQRSHTLVSLSTDCMYLNNSGCAFYISKLLKNSRPKSHQKPIEFKTYPHDISSCAVALIKLYLDKTEALILQALGVVEYALRCTHILTSESVLRMCSDIENHRYVVWVWSSLL